MTTTAQSQIEIITSMRDAVARQINELIAIRGKKTPAGWLKRQTAKVADYNRLITLMGG